MKSIRYELVYILLVTLHDGFYSMKNIKRKNVT